MLTKFFISVLSQSELRNKWCSMSSRMWSSRKIRMCVYVWACVFTESSSSTFFLNIPEIILTKPHCFSCPTFSYRSVSREQTVEPLPWSWVSQSIPLTENTHTHTPVSLLCVFFGCGCVCLCSLSLVFEEDVENISLVLETLSFLQKLHQSHVIHGSTGICGNAAPSCPCHIRSLEDKPERLLLKKILPSASVFYCQNILWLVLEIL